MSRIQVVMFDMDGTLVDSMPGHAAAFSKVMNRRYGIPADYASDVYVRTSGKPVEVQMDIVLESRGLPKAENKPEMEEEFWSAVLAEAPVLFPDVLPALQVLADKGFKMAVISGSAPFVVEEKMKRCGIDSFFSVVLGSDTRIPHMTKGPGHLGIVQRTLGLSDDEFRNSSAIVGDAEHDMVVAKQAGLLAVARVTPETRASLVEFGADYTVESLGDLPSVFADYAADASSA